MVTEISIFLENEPGELAALINLLRANDISIRGASVAETADYGLVYLLVNKPKECLALLKEKKYDISSVNVLAVKLTEDYETLFDIAKILGDNGVNIEYLYSTSVKEGFNLMIVNVNDYEKGREVLEKEGLEIIDSFA